MKAIKDFKNSKGKWVYTKRIDGLDVHTRSYDLWIAMTGRCKKLGSINGFDNFQYFADWVNSKEDCMKMENNRYWCLDKDIIKPFNKIYSPETCCFIPSKLNLSLSFKPKTRSEYPIGVHQHRLKYVAQGNSEGKTLRLGSFECPFEAHREWQRYKIQQLANLKIEFDFLPNEVILGIDLHKSLIEYDFNNKLETVR